MTLTQLTPVTVGPSIITRMSSSTSSSSSFPANHRLQQTPFSASSLSDLIETLQSHDELTARQHEQQRQHSATLLDQLRSLHSLCTELQHRNAALTNDFDSLSAVHRQLQAEYSHATANTTRLHDQLTQCRRERKEEAERYEMERIRQTAALSDLGQQLMAITASHQQKDQALATVVHERDAQQHRIETLEEELTESNAECEQLTGQLQTAEEERDEWVEENTRLEERLKASEMENKRMAELKERVERELQAHLDIAVTIHGLSQKAMAGRGGSKMQVCKTAVTGDRGTKPRIVLGELDMNRT